MPKQIRQYGTWSSPVTPKQVADSLRLNEVVWHNDTLLWHESRGAQGVVMAQTGTDAPRELSGDYSVKGRVGYGGGEFTAKQDAVYFVASGRLYKQALTTGSARALTPGFGGAAAPQVSPDGKWVAFIHTYEGVDGLAIVDSDGKQWARKLMYGTDFAMQPVWHPNSQQLAYIAWNHPNMPWDGTELRLLSLDDNGNVTHSDVIAGDTNTAIFQPEFSPDGCWLSYISDKTGNSQLYLYDLETKQHKQITQAEAEHGAPGWTQGTRTYAWAKDRLYYRKNEQGVHSLWYCKWDGSDHQPVDALKHYTYFSQITVSPVDDALALIVSSSKCSSRVISYHPERGERIHRRTTPESIPAEAYADAQAITWKGHDGETVYGLYYPPTSERYAGTGAPPLIVYVHGGPTSQSVARFEAEHQFFATRGYAVLAVNHRGSTGYGRDYARKLYGNWGGYDVEDSVSGAQHLISQGLADASRVVITGGSAGGYTVLQSLVDKPGFYKAAICKYGISNQFMLVQDTHKFEAQYSFSLLGNLPEAADLFRKRSPIFHAEKLKDPVIVFQGEEDTVVPRSQSDVLVASLKERGIPHEYHLFAGEGHGFRKPETIETVLKATLKFLEQHVIYA